MNIDKKESEKLLKRADKVIKSVYKTMRILDKRESKLRAEFEKQFTPIRKMRSECWSIIQESVEIVRDIRQNSCDHYNRGSRREGCNENKIMREYCKDCDKEFGEV